VQQRDEDPATGAAEGVAQRDGAAARIDVVDAEAEDLRVGLDDGGEGLVELPHGDVLLLQAGARQHQGHDLGRRHGEVDGVDGRVAVADDAREHAAAGGVLGGERPGGEHEGAGAVAERRRVGGGDGGVGAFGEGRLQRRHLVRLQLGELLVLLHHHVALFALDRHRHDFLVEQPLCPRLLRALVAEDRVLVLLLSGDAVHFGGVFRAVAHVDLVVDVPESVDDETVRKRLVTERWLLARSWEVVRHACHVLHTTGDHGIGLAQLDCLRGERYRLQS